MVVYRNFRLHLNGQKGYVCPPFSDGFRNMPLTEPQKRHLRKLAHNLKPVIIIGNAGFSEGVANELELTLEHHELIKVRVNAEDREARDALIQQICERARCELVQRIGHIAVLYRPAQEPTIRLPR
jgi:RNA-binding protein